MWEIDLPANPTQTQAHLLTQSDPAQAHAQARVVNVIDGRFGVVVVVLYAEEIRSSFRYVETEKKKNITSIVFLSCHTIVVLIFL